MQEATRPQCASWELGVLRTVMGRQPMATEELLALVSSFTSAPPLSVVDGGFGGRQCSTRRWTSWGFGASDARSFRIAFFCRRLDLGLCIE